MYGNDASVQALEASIVQAAAALAAVRDGVQNSAAALDVLASEDEALAPFAERLVALANDYDVMATMHADRAAAAQEGSGFLRNNVLIRWIGSDRYRSLHREYGAMVAERGVLMARYESLRSDLQAFVNGASLAVPQGRGRYQVVPPYYRQLEYDAQHQELSDILANIGAES